MVPLFFRENGRPNFCFRNWAPVFWKTDWITWTWKISSSLLTLKRVRTTLFIVERSCPTLWQITDGMLLPWYYFEEIRVYMISFLFQQFGALFLCLKHEAGLFWKNMEPYELEFSTTLILVNQNTYLSGSVYGIGYACPRDILDGFLFCFDLVLSLDAVFGNTASTNPERGWSISVHRNILQYLWERTSLPRHRFAGGDKFPIPPSSYGFIDSVKHEGTFLQKGVIWAGKLLVYLFWANMLLCCSQVSLVRTWFSISMY